MQELIKGLEQISHNAISKNLKELLPQLQNTKKLAQSFKQDQLVQEISAWESKLDVILAEPIGRKGMSRHASHWI